MFFYSCLIALTRISSSILNTSGESEMVKVSGESVSFLILKENFSFLLLSMILDVGLNIWPLYVEVNSFMPSVFRFSFTKVYWI